MEGPLATAVRFLVIDVLLVMGLTSIAMSQVAPGRRVLQPFGAGAVTSPVAGNPHSAPVQSSMDGRSAGQG